MDAKIKAPMMMPSVSTAHQPTTQMPDRPWRVVVHAVRAWLSRREHMDGELCSHTKLRHAQEEGREAR